MIFTFGLLQTFCNFPCWCLQIPFYYLLHIRIFQVRLFAIHLPLFWTRTAITFWSCWRDVARTLKLLGSLKFFHLQRYPNEIQCPKDIYSRCLLLNYSRLSFFSCGKVFLLPSLKNQDSPLEYLASTNQIASRPPIQIIS